jgi:glycine oxidase
VRADILIIGQGLAGTLIGWECERAGLAFEIVDQGHATAATRVAAGIINPVTGRRLVKTWRVETLLPLARETYQRMGDALGVSLWRELRVRRLFADDVERAAFHRKRLTGELAPFVTEAGDETGFWIERAARVDLPTMLAAMRARWEARGRLQVRRADPRVEQTQYAWVIDCTGNQGARGALVDVAPWEFSKGEVLGITVSGLDSDVVLNRRHWVMPSGREAAWVGATHESGVVDPTPTAEGRARLEGSARDLLGREFRVNDHRAGVRVTLPDKLPAAGRTQTGIGVANALGGKGALFGPMLAAEWAKLIQFGTPLDSEFDVARFEI